MANNMFNLLLHPIRMRIVTAISNDQVTAKDVAQALPDIPQTTLYRHIKILLDGGVLEVIDEIPQRGTVERVLGVTAPPSLTQEDLKGLSKEEYRQIFSIIMSNMLNEANSSLNNFTEEEEIDLLGSGFQFSEIRLNLSDEEYETMNQNILELMMTAAQNKPTPDRKRRTFAYFFIPLVETPNPGSD